MSSARRAHGQAAIDMYLEIWDATCHIYSRFWHCSKAAGDCCHDCLRARMVNQSEYLGACLHYLFRLLHRFHA